MKMDETLYGIADKIRNFAQIYLVDITEVRYLVINVGFLGKHFYCQTKNSTIPSP